MQIALTQHFVFRLSVLTAALLAAIPAQAISIRHDVAAQNYFDLAAPYGAVARVSGGGFIATGTLVSPTKFLTAAHFVDSDRNGIPNAGLSYTIRFGTNVDAPTYTINSFSSAAVHPNWSTSGGSSTYDLAVLTLTNPFNNITPMLISDQPVTVGMTATMVGYGTNGTGTVFNNALDGKRRAATNIIDVASTTIRTDFDSPTGNTNYYTTGSATPLALEGTTAGGDSGGPLIVNFGAGDRLVGTLQGGFNSFGDFSEYGDVSIWAPISTASNIEFLEAQGVAVPEPGSLAALTVGVIALVRRRR